MSKTLNEMVHTIVDHYDSINQAADAIGVHFATIDRLLNDETATAQARTTEKIEALYEEIARAEEPQEKITELEIGKAYEIKIPKSGSSTMMIHRGVAKKEYRQFYQLDNDGKSITILKADLINERTTVTPIDAPAKETEEPVDVEYVPVVDKVEEPTEEITDDPKSVEFIPTTEKEKSEKIEEGITLDGLDLYEKIEANKKAKEKAKRLTEKAPEIQGETVAERLNYCLSIVERCNRKIAEGEKAKKDKAAILPLMDEIYKEFRG